MRMRQSAVAATHGVIAQGVLRLGACHVRRARLLRHASLPEVERPVLAEAPGLLLILPLATQSKDTTRVG